MSATTRETAARSALSSIADERAAQATMAYARDDKRPTGKQVYRAFYLLCEIAGIDAPQSSREASELIAHLTGQRDAVFAQRAPSDFAAGF